MAAIDNYVGIPQKDGPFTSAAAVTLSDTVDLTNVTRALWIGTAGTGTLTVIMQDGQTVQYNAVPAGIQLNIRCTRVKATGTGVSNVVALW